MVNIHHQQPLGAVADEPALALFLSQWEIYRKFVDSEYGAHTEAYGILHRLLSEDVGGPFRLLDLACGDARSMVGALRGTRIVHYHGIDLAQPALGLAREALAALSCGVELEHGDSIEAMRDRPEPADVVWMGLSLHHLPAPEKRALISEIRRIIGPGGFLVIYEPVTLDNETRDGYLDRYEDIATRRWTAFTPAELDGLMSHVRICDIPETVSSWMALGRDAGFSRTEQLYVDPNGLFRMFRYWP